MTRPADEVHRDLPRTDDIRHPPRKLLYWLRAAVTVGIRRHWQLEHHGTEHFPATGPVVVVANHIGWLDGPLMAIVGPRPVHALTKREMFHGPVGRILRASGQIPLYRDQADPLALRTGIRVLRDGKVVGMFPEGTRGGGELTEFQPGAAYLAMVAGARVVPLAMLGSRLPGGASGSLPPHGTRIVMTYGEPVEVAKVDWPRRSAEVARVSETIRQALRDTILGAEQATGISLPGPLPDPEEARDKS